MLEWLMLTNDEEDYLSKIPANKKAHVFPFDLKTAIVAKKIIKSIKNIYPNLEVKHMGASALGISGQNDVDIYAFSDPVHFEKFLPGLIRLFGEPLHRHETFIQWSLKKDNIDVEFYLTAQDSKTMQKQIRVFEILKSDGKLLREYEKIKESMNEKSFKEYQKKKYEFYHKLLD